MKLFRQKKLICAEIGEIPTKSLNCDNRHIYIHITYWIELLGSGDLKINAFLKLFLSTYINIPKLCFKRNRRINTLYGKFLKIHDYRRGIESKPIHYNIGRTYCVACWYYLALFIGVTSLSMIFPTRDLSINSIQSLSIIIPHHVYLEVSSMCTSYPIVSST